MTAPIEEPKPDEYVEARAASYGLPVIPKEYQEEGLAVVGGVESLEERDFVTEVLKEAGIPCWCVPSRVWLFRMVPLGVQQGEFDVRVPASRLAAAQAAMAAVEAQRKEFREGVRKKYAALDEKARLREESRIRDGKYVPEATTIAQRRHAWSALWMIVLTFFLAPLAPIMLGYNLRLLRRIRSDQARLVVDAMEENPLPLAIISTGLAVLWCIVLALLAIGSVIQG
jgi:hypothetical protein